MPNTKISEDPVASTLSGTEVVPVLQGGFNKQTTIQDIIIDKELVSYNPTTNNLERNNSPILVTNTLYAGVSAMNAETPAANTFAYLSQAAFVGDGAPIAPVPVVYTGTRWAPFGNRQTLFKAQFGTTASPNRTISGAPGKFTFTNDPVIPANLLKVGDSLLFTARFQRHGTAAMTLGTYLGNNTTYSVNSLATSIGLAANDGGQQEQKSEVVFVTSTTASATRALNPNSSATASQIVLLNTSLDIATAMKIFWAATVMTDSADLLHIQVDWLAGTYI